MTDSSTMTPAHRAAVPQVRDARRAVGLADEGVEERGGGLCEDKSEYEGHGSHGQGLSDVAEDYACAGGTYQPAGRHLPDSESHLGCGQRDVVEQGSAGGTYQPAGCHLPDSESHLGSGQRDVVEQGEYQQQHSGGGEEPQHVPVYDVLEGEGVIGPASVVHLLERYQAVFSAETGHIESVAFFQYA